LLLQKAQTDQDTVAKAGAERLQRLSAERDAAALTGRVEVVAMEARLREEADAAARARLAAVEVGVFFL
jgi:hypothetical protein